jgi:hypothetical protein
LNPGAKKYFRVQEVAVKSDRLAVLDEGMTFILSQSPGNANHRNASLLYRRGGVCLILRTK